MSAQDDQTLAKLRDITPGIWWAFYQGSIDKGFTKQQAWYLLCLKIVSDNNIIIPRNPDENTTEKDDSEG